MTTFYLRFPCVRTDAILAELKSSLWKVPRVLDPNSSFIIHLHHSFVIRLLFVHHFLIIRSSFLHHRSVLHSFIIRSSSIHHPFIIRSSSVDRSFIMRSFVQHSFRVSIRSSCVHRFVQHSFSIRSFVHRSFSLILTPKFEP
jgi:hypothetical protein